VLFLLKKKHASQTNSLEETNTILINQFEALLLHFHLGFLLQLLDKAKTYVELYFNRTVILVSIVLIRDLAD